MPEPSEGTEAGQEAAEGKENSSEEVAASKTIPDGIVPLFVSGPGQQIFGCVADSDVTVENPHKLISKEKILEDFRNRAAVSDFHPVKKAMTVRPHGAPVFYLMHTGRMYVLHVLLSLHVVMYCMWCVQEALWSVAMHRYILLCVCVRACACVVGGHSHN